MKKLEDIVEIKKEGFYLKNKKINDLRGMFYILSLKFIIDQDVKLKNIFNTLNNIDGFDDFIYQYTNYKCIGLKETYIFANSSKAWNERLENSLLYIEKNYILDIINKILEPNIDFYIAFNAKYDTIKNCNNCMNGIFHYHYEKVYKKYTALDIGNLNILIGKNKLTRKEGIDQVYYNTFDSDINISDFINVIYKEVNPIH